jgi:aldose 1-epimerase
MTSAAPAPRAASPPTGEQHEIVAGPYRAVVVSGGGGIRVLQHEGRDLLDGYARDALPDGARGQVLAPWPNRLRNGRWQLDGREQQLPVDDVAFGHAIHGLVRWSAWLAEVHTRRRAVLRHRLHARPGYPFVLDLHVVYTVDADEGLAVHLVAQNVGSRPAPVALGMHPYLAAPHGGSLDSCTLLLPATHRVLVDERRIPVFSCSVERTAFDLRRGRRVGSIALDDTYTGLVPGPDGRVHVELAAPDGRTTELWTEGRARWLQIFTGDTLSPQRRRHGVAVEPMTAPANALATGEGLVVLQPGRATDLRWGVVARRTAVGGLHAPGSGT